MNIFEKIISKRIGRLPKVGEKYTFPVDWLMVHDGSIMMVERYYQEMGFNSVFNPEKIFVVFDHIFPANNAETATLHNKARNFIKKHKIQNFFDGGKGICHQILLESELIKSGDIVIGGDSHSPTVGGKGCYGFGAGATDITYSMLSGKTWGFFAPVVNIHLKSIPTKNLSAKDVVLFIAGNIDSDLLLNKHISFTSEVPMPLDWRVVLCNMAPELGALTAIFEPDSFICNKHPNLFLNDYKAISTDHISDYDNVIEIDISKIAPLIAAPSQVRNVVEAKKRGIKVDVVFIGSCTGGRYEDLEIAANVFRASNKELKARLLICPASKNIYVKAMNDGLISEFLDLGATILPPSCGPCLGQNMGVLADGEVCVSTSNRNYKGRMGNKNSEIYLSSPYIAAKAALEGEI